MAHLDPYKLHPKPPRIALLTSSGEALDEYGELHELEHLPGGTRCYASWDAVEDLLREGRGETYCWDGEPIRWRHRNYREDVTGWTRRHNDVIVIRLPFPPAENAALEGLVGWRDWLEEHRASPQGSLGSTAMSLLRATLSERLVTARGQLPPIRWTMGGRQELAVDPRTTVTGAQHFDLPAAYARTIGEMRYGGIWRELEPRRHGPPAYWAKDERPVFAHATVKIPGLRFGPLPRRPRHKPPAGSWERCPELGGTQASVFPTDRKITGTWVWDELDEAIHAGATVEVDRYWVHSTDLELGRPFTRWWAVVQEGRRMPGLAGQLAKASANALWGQWCISEGKRELVTWRKGERQTRVIHAEGGGMPRSWDLAELVTGRVRAALARMMREMGPAVVSVHTDGGWLRGGPVAPDGWAVKDRARRLDIVGPQMLRYWREDRRGAPLYRVAGVPSRLGPQVFQAIWGGPTPA